MGFGRISDRGFEDTSLLDVRGGTRVEVELHGGAIFAQPYHISGHYSGFFCNKAVVNIGAVLGLAIYNSELILIYLVLNDAAMLAADGIFLNRIEGYIVGRATADADLKAVPYGELHCLSLFRAAHVADD